jgi:hypothetical protein
MNVMNDQDPTTFSPRADDVTTASAWSSSPLGDPADEAEYHPYRYKFPPEPITSAAWSKSISKATLAAGLVTHNCAPSATSSSTNPNANPRTAKLSISDRCGPDAAVITRRSS